MVAIWGVVGKMATKLKKWRKGSVGARAQEIGEGEVMEQDLKQLAVNMEKREIKVRQSSMAWLHPICDVVC